MKPITSYYNFAGKVVVITGGSRGMGHAMAIGFAQAGARVAVASRKIESCEATVDEIRALGSDGSAHATHVGKWDDCNRLAEEVYARWGRADVLINNAGLSPLAPSSLDTGEETFNARAVAADKLLPGRRVRRAAATRRRTGWRRGGGGRPVRGAGRSPCVVRAPR